MAIGDQQCFGISSTYTYRPSSGVEYLVKELNLSWNYTSNYFRVYGQQAGASIYQSWCPFIGTLYNKNRRGPNALYNDSYDWCWDSLMQGTKQSIPINHDNYLYFMETGTGRASFRGIITKD